MATSKTFTRSHSHYQYFTGPTTAKPTTTTISDFELDESDLWNNNNNPTSPQKHTIRRISSKSSSSPAKRSDVLTTASSLPVNVPDWSKILKQDYRDNRRGSDYYDEDGEFEEFDGGASRIPPHEFLAKQMAASFSVHEGVGRTLKGRDLSRVRNAIWEKTGFQD